MNLLSFGTSGKAKKQLLVLWTLLILRYFRFADSLRDTVILINSFERSD